MSADLFKSWPKIPRFGNINYTITEKIDGTNGCVIVTEDNQVFAQSRTEVINIENDNAGFAQWVEDNREELLSLGMGYHYGEWWGYNIQRTYNQEGRLFSLFSWWRKPSEIPPCCRIVPIVANTLGDAIERLHREGSIASPGYKNPEGLILQSKDYPWVYYKYIINKGYFNGIKKEIGG